MITKTLAKDILPHQTVKTESKKTAFKLIMISAMYENGGNTLHRHLDGHPELSVYPFESQLGTATINDHLTSLFPTKYRWPEFSLSGTVDNDYEQIIDEEFKVRVNTPDVSKFRNVSDMGCTNAERKKLFLDLMKGKPRTRANLIEAFFCSTFDSWRTRKASKKEHISVGYSPIIGVDTEKIIADFPDAVVLHIVRNPFASYAETQHRPVPYTLERYIQTWNIVQLMVLNFSGLYPHNVVIVRFEDLVQNKRKFFSSLCKKLSISYNDTMLYPSWNGTPLKHQYPWGIIDIPTGATPNHEEYTQIKKQSALINNALRYHSL